MFETYVLPSFHSKFRNKHRDETTGSTVVLLQQQQQMCCCGCGGGEVMVNRQWYPQDRKSPVLSVFGRLHICFPSNRFSVYHERYFF